MNVGMAVLAALTDVGENHLDVAAGAGYGSVHTAQRIACLVMVELGHGTDRFPAIRRVTVLAGNGQVTVRRMRAFRGLRAPAFPESGKSKDQKKNEFRFYPSAHKLPLAFVLYPTYENQETPADDKLNIGSCNSQSIQCIELQSLAKSYPSDGPEG